MFQVPSLILHCNKTLKFPKSKTIDEATVDLIRGLLRDETVRLGKNGIHEIVTHPFFSSINWQSMGIINTNLLYVCFIILSSSIGSSNPCQYCAFQLDPLVQLKSAILIRIRVPGAARDSQT